MSEKPLRPRSRRQSIKLAGASAVAAVLASFTHEEVALAADPLKVKKAKVATVTLKLHRQGEKGKSVVATIDLANVAQKLQSLGT